MTLALVQKRVDHIAERMGQVMVRTARSPIFNESHDFSCFLTEAAGRLVSQADGIPIHTGGGGLIVERCSPAFDDIAPGDVFISSDPYVAGGNHLPDWVITRPVFVDGASSPSSATALTNRTSAAASRGPTILPRRRSSTKASGLPPLRLIERGTLRQDLWQLLLLNSRCPDLLEGDLQAMLGSTQVGAERMHELAEDLGPVDRLRYIDGILDRADRRMRDAVAGLPDGVYMAPR